MTNYQRGVRLEREIVQLFRDGGWEAGRTAGSHSAFDVVCASEQGKVVEDAHTLLHRTDWFLATIGSDNSFFNAYFTRECRGRREHLWLATGCTATGCSVALIQLKRRKRRKASKR